MFFLLRIFLIYLNIGSSPQLIEKAMFILPCYTSFTTRRSSTATHGSSGGLDYFWHHHLLICLFKGKMTIFLTRQKITKKGVQNRGHQHWCDLIKFRNSAWTWKLTALGGFIGPSDGFKCRSVIYNSQF